MQVAQGHTGGWFSNMVSIFLFLKKKLFNFTASNDIILLFSAIKAETKRQSACFIKRFVESGDREGLA